MLKKHGVGDRRAPQQLPLAGIFISGLTKSITDTIKVALQLAIVFRPSAHSQRVIKPCLFLRSAPTLSSPALHNSGG